MSKQDFLDSLRNSLSGNMSLSRIEEHINYYDSYIQNQIRLGLSEEALFGQLGDPRLIAKSLIEANIESEKEDSSQYFEEEKIRRKISIKGWLYIILIIIILILIVSAFFSLVWSLLPFIIPCIGAIWIVRILSK